MWIEGHGGGTDRPMLWVRPGGGAPSMGFEVAQNLWDYIDEHGMLDLVYNRKAMQAKFDALQAMLDSPPVQTVAKSAAAAVAPAVRALPTGKGAVTGWSIVGGAVLAGVAIAQAARRHVTR